MKVLMVHNFYRSVAPSGENTAFWAEKQLLCEHGHTVRQFTTHSDDLTGTLGMVQASLAVPWNPFVRNRIRKFIENHKPDIMHVHNPFPIISPAVFQAARGTTTATVWTLHNYRIGCAAGIPTRKNLPCTRCIDRRNVAAAMYYGCYRNSRPATLPLAAMIALHRYLKTWQLHVDAFIVLSPFQKQKMIAFGLDPRKIFIKPHFFTSPGPVYPWSQRDMDVVFIGRISQEKGIRYLIRAWQDWGDSAPCLHIIGEGPEQDHWVRWTAKAGMAHRIRFHGQLPFETTQQILSRARLLILPSICFEGFPMVIREAFAWAVPVAVSRIGGLPGIVDDGKTGVLFQPANAKSMSRTLQRLWNRPDHLKQMARNARQTFEQLYTQWQNHDMLMDIYSRAIANRRSQQ